MLNPDAIASDVPYAVRLMEFDVAAP